MPAAIDPGAGQVGAGAEAGGGGDDFTYSNITINNTKVTSPQVVLDGDVEVTGTLTQGGTRKPFRMDVEVVALCGLYSIMGYMTTAFDIRIEEGLPKPPF